MDSSSAQSVPSSSSFLRLLRPRQWVKNFFVLPAPLFGHKLDSFKSVLCLTGVFIAFSLLSSAVYVLNDLIDAEADRQHPVKRLRPIAAGRVSVKAALGLSLCLFFVTLALASSLGAGFALVCLVYLLNNISYSFFFKRRVIADVLSIALGFMLRILAGAVALDVEPSNWLMLCGFSVALFLGFCKRRSEIGRFSDGEQAGGARAVLSIYTEEKLNLLTSSTATMAIVTYMLFTVSPETRALHGTAAFLYTSPFVVYCVLRFLMKALELHGEDAAETIFKDLGFLSAGLGWVLTVAWILYWR
jgi:4-hydroxybenzoate polyprenyltransferase